jgi:hypothetical protein
MAVAGCGAVSPPGIGVEPLLRAAAAPEITGVPSLSRPDHSHQVYRVSTKQEPLRALAAHPRLRRASPVSLFMAEAVRQAGAGLSSAQWAATGLVSVFTTGSIIPSRRFFAGVLDQGHHLASPALFPETVYNSPASHVAAVHGMGGAAYAIVGDDAAWVEGLRIASLWLGSGRAERVIVVAAEEIEDVALEAYAAAGWMKDGYVPAEGAGAVLLERAAEKESRPTLEPSAVTHGYRHRREIPDLGRRVLAEVAPDLPVLPTAERTWLEKAERVAVKNENALSSPSYAGHAFAASAAWHTVRLLAAEKPGRLITWGLNAAVSGLAVWK